MKTKFQNKWSEIATQWDLQVEVPFVIDLISGPILVPVLLRDFGALNGMLLVTDYNIIAHCTNELMDLNYGFSCLTESVTPYNPKVDDKSLYELLKDWGWNGVGNPPGRLC